MSKKNMFAVIAVAVLAIVAAGGILASNMGFKLNYPLTRDAAGGGVGSGRNTLALPYFRQTGVNTAYELMLDIGGGTVSSVGSVSRYNEPTDTFAAYTGRMGAGAPFALAAGDSHLIAMNSNVNYIVVGSHNPALTTSLDGPGIGSGRNFFGPPYNITSTNAYGLILDIGGGTVSAVGSVSRFNKPTDTFAAYTGRMGAGAPFALVPGEGYLVAMNSTVAYIASHY